MQITLWSRHSSHFRVPGLFLSFIKWTLRRRVPFWHSCSKTRGFVVLYEHTHTSKGFQSNCHNDAFLMESLSNIFVSLDLAIASGCVFLEHPFSLEYLSGAIICEFSFEACEKRFRSKFKKLVFLFLRAWFDFILLVVRRGFCFNGLHITIFLIIEWRFRSDAHQILLHTWNFRRGFGVSSPLRWRSEMRRSAWLLIQIGSPLSERGSLH